MSIASEIARIKESTATIRSKYVELGISQSTDKIDDLATASQQIENKGAVTATVSEGTTYTIPKGYHNGSGTVTGIAPAADATVETWETPDMTGPDTPEPYSVSDARESAEGHEAWMAFDGNAGTYWLTKGIPSSTGENYDEAHLLCFRFGAPTVITGIRLTPAPGEAVHRFPKSASVWGINGELESDDWFNDFITKTNEDPEFVDEYMVKKFTDPVAGEAQESELKTKDQAYQTYVIYFEPRYVEINDESLSDEELDAATNAASTVAIAEIEFRTKESVSKYSLQSKIITPTTQQQNVTPDQGYYGLSAVTVNPIPSNYKDVSIVSATAEDVLSGKIIVGKDGRMIAGTMANNGTIDRAIDGITTTSVALPAGYYEGGSVYLDDTIENALSEI